MARIIELLGGRGVGKSTLISAIKEINRKNIMTKEGFRLIEDGVDISTYKGFLEHERNYLKSEIDEMNNYEQTEGVVIITRGPRDVLLYLDYIIEKKHPEWSDIYLDLAEEINVLKSKASQICIYLDAPDTFLVSNMTNDKNKKRENIQLWMDFNSFEKEKLLNDTNVIFIGVNEYSKDELIRAVNCYV